MDCCDAGINEFHRDNCLNKICHDCGAFVNRENHKDDCLFALRLNESFRQDSKRWIEGYGYMSTQAVRARVVASQNGHG
jgi:hypothetical protein